MDEPIEVNNKFFSHRKIYLKSTLIVVVAITLYLFKSEDNALYKVEPLTSSLVIRTSGVLRPLIYRDLYSPQDGEIKYITENKAGEKTNKGDLIFSVFNSEIESLFSQKRKEYSDEEYEFQQKLISLKQDISKTELEKLSIEAKYEGAKSELLAYSKHPDVIPTLELNIKKREIELLEKQITQLMKISEDQHLNVKQFENNWQNKKEYMNVELGILSATIEALNIKSPIDGNIEYIDESLQIGKVVSKGQVLGRVSDFSFWAAYLDVPVASIDRIKIGDRVILDVNGHSVAGSIYQIDQKVENQTIKIIAKIKDDNLTILRSELRVNASIATEENRPLSIIRLSNNIPLNSKTLNVIAHYKDGTKNKIEIKVQEISSEKIIFESLGSHVEAIGFY